MKPLKTEDPSTTALSLTPMAMIEQAIQGKADVAILERLMALQERWETNEARREFDAAIARARAEIKPILKTQDVNLGIGKGSYKYETLSDIADAIDDELGEENLYYRYTSSQNGDLITVTCIVSHARGHREQATLSGRPDTTGSKNPIQAIGSAVTYLQRYTLKLALGLSAAKDDDARAAGTSTIDAEPASPSISDAQYDSLLSYLEAAAMPPNKVLEGAKVESLHDLTVKQYLELEEVLKERIERIKRKEKAAKPKSSTDIADTEAAEQMGRSAHAQGFGKLQWPPFWKDQANIEAWKRGWRSAEEEALSASERGSEHLPAEQQKQEE
jgi:hypothetical protein